MSHSAKQALAENARALKQLRQQRNRAKLRDASCGLGPRAVHSVLAAYVHSGYKSDLAGDLAKKLWKRKIQEEEPVWPRAVEDMFLQMSDAVLDSILEPVAELDQKSVARAKAFIAKADVADWVAEQNFSYGVAPSSWEIEQEFRRNLGCEAASDIEAMVDPSEQRRIRRWVQRWGKEFGVDRGKLEYREDVPPSELQQKAWCCKFFVMLFACSAMSVAIPCALVVIFVFAL